MRRGGADKIATHHVAAASLERTLLASSNSKFVLLIGSSSRDPELVKTMADAALPLGVVAHGEWSSVGGSRAQVDSDGRSLYIWAIRSCGRV